MPVSTNQTLPLEWQTLRPHVGLVRRFWHNVLSDVQETTLAPRSTARNLHGAQHLSARSSRSHSLNDDVLHGSLLAPAGAALLFSLAWRDCEIDVVARSIFTGKPLRRCR
jgi:hypothetical protein